MSDAKTGDTVKVHYNGKFDDGEVFDSSEGRDPLAFKLGEGSVIQGFEEAVTGMTVGDTKEQKIPAEMAYGPYFDDLSLDVKKDQLPADMVPAVGQQLEVGQEDGSTVPVRITAIAEDSITLDANHPLAGKDLTFNITLVSVD